VVFQDNTHTTTPYLTQHLKRNFQHPAMVNSRVLLSFSNCDYTFMHSSRFSLISLCVVLLFLVSCKQEVLPEEQLRSRQQAVVNDMLDKLDNGLLPCIQKQEADSIQYYFIALRHHYKTIQAGMEYFMPGTAKGINGSPLPEVEIEGNAENPPAGLQVMESFIFPVYDTASQQSLIIQARQLRGMLQRAKQLWEVQQPAASQWWDALYYESIRIATMGITGFDTPGSATGLQESLTALIAVYNQLSILQYNQVDPVLENDFEKAFGFLKNADDFNAFNRTEFLRTYWQPIFAAIATIRKDKLPETARMAMYKNATSLFGNQVLDPQYYAGDSLGTNEELAALGEKLFYDTRLSNNGKFSCATCHQPEMYFGDNNALSDNIHGTPLSRNTPALMNTVFQTNFFWDMRVNNLEMQARQVVDNQFEMHGSLTDVCKLLSKDRTLTSQMEDVFNTKDTISEMQVMRALAAYQRTLIGYNSPFDDYMNGDDKAISEDAIAGFNLFMGKAKCGTCHFAPTFSGLVPPYYDKMESEVLGTPSTNMGNTADKDKGRGELFPAASYMHAFKTPTVRNAAQTFPYMHNGVYNTLEEIVDFYNKGGGEGLGYSVPNQTLPFDSLSLSAKEQKQIVVFMQALTDKPFDRKGISAIN